MGAHEGGVIKLLLSCNNSRCWGSTSYLNPCHEMEDDLRPEYNFAQMEGGVRGKYVERYRAGMNLVLLDPDVAQAFPNDAAVNDALRVLIQIAQRLVSPS